MSSSSLNISLKMGSFLSDKGTKASPNLKSKALWMVIPLMIIAAFPVGAQMIILGFFGSPPSFLRMFSALAVMALIAALLPTPAPT